MNKELMEALDLLEKEKQISREVLFEAIENSLLAACKNHFGKADNVKVEIDRETCDYLCYAEKEVVEEVEDPAQEFGIQAEVIENASGVDSEKSPDEAVSEAISAEIAKQPVTKDMNIKYILSLHPESSVILMSIGMGCISCFAAEMETLAEACVVHGLDPDDVTEYLNGELGLLPVE